MSIKLKAYYEKQKTTFIKECIGCGKCLKKCALGHYWKNDRPLEVMDAVRHFFNNESFSQKFVEKKAFCCLECFKCAQNVCPKGINPMDINEILRFTLREKNTKVFNFDPPGNFQSDILEICDKKLSKSEIQRITHISSKQDSKYLFFPGCNVYWQPEKIIKALKIIDKITDDYTFLPGQIYCCGNNPIYYGDFSTAELSAQQFYDAILYYRPKTVILWCPTCLCRIHSTLSGLADFSTTFISFGSFIASHLSDLRFKHLDSKKVTLHEPCKLAYNGYDTQCYRTILNSLPGLKLIEMAHTHCCGCGLEMYSNQLAESLKKSRLNEAVKTKAATLVDICHACHSFFSDNNEFASLEILNYVDLLDSLLD